MTRMSVITFHDLVRSKYVDGAGWSVKRTVTAIAGQTLLSFDTVQNAYEGRRVLPESARALSIWAAEIHLTDIDEPALMAAPTRPPRSQGDAGKRAEEAIEAAVHRACLPPELACTVSYDLSVGAWLVRCINRLGGPDNEQTHVDLPEALSAVVERHHGGRSA